eukprot:TRINITY_DN540_c0_g1_i1.p1 TRINITY_DN540_c0_g1~~TRINITY_DN540_c0_g1_i1.p1  ORF type:complete len:203 (-),score=45.39 TRINITY_DN540_c0_g1_i1:135-743(-)
MTETFTSQVRIGKPAPDFTADAVLNGEFIKINLSSFKGKYVFFFFYPLDFTFVCPTEIVAFNDRLDEFKKLNVEVIGASVDSKHTHLAWLNTPLKSGGIGGLNYPLVADLTHDISKKYGVYLEEEGHSARGSFIIDGKGIVRQLSINDDPAGRSVEEVLRLIQALQFADENGVVCPANWRPGQKTLVADPVKSKEYFGAVHH